MPPCLIRPATHQDINALLTLEDICFTTDKMSRRSYRDLLKQSSAAILVAEQNQTIIGSATVFFRKNSKVARLYSLAVHPDHRQHGIAYALCGALENIALTRHCTVMTLEVREENTAAIRFYEKLKYQPTGKYETFYEDGAPAQRMKKSLTTHESS